MSTLAPPIGGPDIELEIGGMTCASCANRIEKKLNKLEGVAATVNYATEKAKVTVPAGYDPGLLVAEVEKTGYTAALPKPKGTTANTSETEAGEEEDTELTSLRHRLVGAIVLTVPVIAMAMIPALQFVYWQWASLALAAPVIIWAAWPFHKAAWTNLKHGTATMDTLISMGTTAAFLWSLDRLSTTETDQRRALLLPQEITRLPPHQAILLRPGLYPIRCRRLRYFKDRTFTRLLRRPPTVPPIEIPVRLDQGKGFEPIAAEGAPPPAPPSPPAPASDPAAADGSPALPPHQADRLVAAILGTDIDLGSYGLADGKAALARIIDAVPTTAYRHRQGRAAG